MENKFILKRVIMPTVAAPVVFGVVVAMLENFLFRHDQDMAYGIVLLIILAPTPLELFFHAPVDIRAHPTSSLIISTSFYSLIFALMTGLIIYMLITPRKSK